MARHTTRKNGARGKLETIARRTERACKYKSAQRLTVAGRAR